MARRRVGGGRLRVDAARAVAKLRDFQLWDPALWALEIVRAAIALKSSRVRAHGDADDVWVSWEGEPLADTDMVTLFDELVSPVADAARRPLRLLAMGVNSGLGTGTSFVDVLAYRPDAPAHRVRYTPDVLVVDDDSPDGMAVASGLRRLRVEKVEPARGAPSKGAAIHVRRRKGLAVLGRFLSGTEPRELAALRHACEDAPVPVVVGRAAIGGGRSSFDLVRVPLGAGIDGFLALTERSLLSHDSPDALLDVGELGVHLVSYPLDLGLGPARAPIPVRAWVDAPVMPTNASRSDVRRDEPPLAQAIEAARAKVPDLLSAVVGLLATDPATQHATAHHARVRRAALRLVGSFVGGALWHAAARALADHALLPLLDAPLVRDAIGRPRSVLDLAKKSVGALGAPPVHRGDEAIDERLEDWLGDVLWIPPGDAAGYLVGASSPPDVKTHIKKARSALKARAAFRARPERPAALPVEQGQLLSVRLDRVFAPDDPWASTIAKAGELRGEVCLCLPEPGHRFGGAVELMAEGRSVVVEPLALGPRFVAIVEASATRPDLSYQGIVADEALTATLVAVRAAIVRATEGLARWLCGEEPRPFETRREELGRPPEGELRAIAAETIRHGLSDAIAFLGEVGVEQPGSTPGRAGLDEAVKVVRKTKKGAKAARSALFAWDTPLVRADAWRMADGTWRSVRALERDARFGSLGVVAPDRPTHHLPKRPIVVADEREIVTLRRVLPRSLAFLSYAEAGDRPFDPFRVARDVLPTRGAALEVKDERRRGVIVWGVDEPRLELRHANRVLVTQPRPPVLTRCAIVVDDDDLVPAAGWQALAGGAGAREALEPVLAEWEHRMLDAVARAVLDGVPPRELLVHPLVALRPLGEPLRAQLLEAIVRKRDGLAWPSAELDAKLAEIPLVPVARRGLLSIRALRAEPPKGVGFLPPEAIQPGDEVDAQSCWILCTDDEARTLGRLLGREIPSVLPRLEAVRAERRRVLAERAHDTKRELPLDVIGARAKVKISGDGIVAGVVAIPGVASSGAVVSVRVRSREVCTETLPLSPAVVAAVEVERTLVNDELTSLTNEGRGRVVGRVHDAVELVLRDIAEREPTALLDDRSVAGVFRTFANSKRKIELAAFVALPIFRSVQGPRVSARAAIRKGALHIASSDVGWLPPRDGEPRSELDEPIIAAPDEDTRWILGQLTGAGFADRSEDVAELRASRRLAQGLARRPELPWGTDKILVEALTDRSPELARVLGIGEVTLVRSGEGMAWLYSEGTLRHQMPLADPHPGFAIRAALESPVAALGKPSHEREQAILRALALVGERALVVTALSERGLPDWLRAPALGVWSSGTERSRDALAKCACIPTTSGAWTSPREVDELAGRADAVWYTTDASLRVVPDDASRPVLVLDASVVTRQRAAWKLWDATEHLKTLEIRRQNQRRRAARALVMAADAHAAAITHVSLEGDGTSAPRGLVAPLMPGAAIHRCLRLHRGMVEFRTVADPCEWPTNAVVDDLRLVPNDTWDAIADDAVLASVRQEVCEASERAIAASFGAPEGTMSVRVDSGFSRAAVADRKIVLRGALWIDASIDPERLDVVGMAGTHRRGVSTMVGEVRRAIPLRGTLLVHRERGDDDASVERALAAVALRAYARLVREALAHGTLGPDATMAHVVTAIGARLLGPKDLRGNKDTVSCMRPSPTLPRLCAILAATGPVLIERSDEPPWTAAAGDIVLVSDGTLTSAALVTAFSGRVLQVSIVRAALESNREQEIQRAAAAEVNRIAPSAPPIDPDAAARGDQAVAISTTVVVGETAGGERSARARKGRKPTGEQEVLEMLRKRIAALGLTSKKLSVVPIRGRSKEVVTVDTSRWEVGVVLDSPLVARLIAAHDARKEVVVADALDLLAAHVAGELDRELEAVTADHQVRALVSLLEASR